MRLGIYGDSYASAFGNTLTAPTNWFNILAKNMKATKVVNYAKPASSLYFSFKRFLETQHLHDFVVFLITEPHRYPNPITLGTRNDCYVSGPVHIDNLLKTPIGPKDRANLEQLRGWFSSSDEKFNEDMSDLMLDKIESSRKENMIIYPCFINSFSKERFARYKLDSELHPMHSFWHRQMELYGINHETFTALEKDTLCGHLCHEFNEFFADLLINKIKTNKWDHSKFFDVTIKEPKTYYYRNWD